MVIQTLDPCTFMGSMVIIINDGPPVTRNANAGEYVIDQVKSTRVLDSNSAGNPFLT